ncbi:MULTISPECIES: hypothetical protein [Pseudomonas]|uniref:hypothetical protein n=1 Tax=Pseudomonas TaxID=286 RepID=UPI001AEA52E6|nr:MULTISPECIES: hypothetical protein [unclassified Pseudomonas]WQG59229.1 hypothetical protein RHM66_08325 [Pseudomonas sp. RTB3]MBP1127268.1 hypothetical protein [Pseudomonas sp. PvP025]MDQ0401128.1 hypothetical protein [Pseudomonas sp. PvP006]MEB0107725.1 hypothetical protein [Pseudomonas sp. MH9.3]WPX78156.1 hypothetical protein RHM60_18155 [Pseudomonas sp. MH9.3]
MASPNKQQKRAHRAKAKAKQNRTQRAVAAKPDAFAGDDDRIDLESVDLTELFLEMRVASEVSQQAMCAAFLAHPLLALVLEQEGEEEATDFILAALIEYRQWTTDSDDEAAALAWIESAEFQADYVAASQSLVNSQD